MSSPIAARICTPPRASGEIDFEAPLSTTLCKLTTKRCDEQVDAFRGGHRGYERLASPVRHTREGFVDKQRPRVLVRDHLDGAGVHEFIWRFHLDPKVTPSIDGCDACLSCDGRQVWVLPDDAAAGFLLSIEAGWVSPSYGIK